MLTELAVKPVDRVGAEIEEIRKALIGRGIHLKIGRKFDTFEAHIQAEPDRAPVHEQFDHHGDMDGAVDAFWVCGFDADGNLAHTQAAHLLNLGERSIADHLSAHLDNYFPKNPKVVRTSIRANPGPNGSRISGKVVYHGEMWLQKQFRDRSTVALTNRLGILLAVREWDPNAIFGLMNWVKACQGFNMRIGYIHSEPMALTWDLEDSGAEHQVWLVYLERDDIQFLMDLPAVEFASMLQKQLA